MEELEQERKAARKAGPTKDPVKVRELESCRLAQIEMNRQLELTTNTGRREQIVLAVAELDRRMKAALKRSPKEEILRVRFGEVERLLRETDLTIETIAAQTGFAHSHYLQAAFKESRGQTPGEFRGTRARMT